MKNFVSLIEQEYNLQVERFERLPGYANENYKIVSKAGDTFVFKWNRFEKELFDFSKKEAELLNDLAGSVGLQLPEAIPSVNGQLVVLYKKEDAFFRLYTWLPGTFLADVSATGELIRSFGKAMAHLDSLLKNKGKIYEVAARVIDFDLSHMIMLRERISSVTDPHEKKYIWHFFNQFEQNVFPKYDSLRHQLIHNDANDYNVLVTENEVTGLIDFGDLVYAPLVQEVAVALTYVMLDKNDPFETAVEFIKGYHAVFPLFKEEIDLLYYLIGARLAMSLMNASHAYKQNPDNEYLLISRKPALKLIKKWAAISPRAVSNLLREAVGFKKQSQELPEKLLEKRKKLLGPSISVSYQKPILMDGALFQYMFDHQGNTILDSYNNIPHVGHNHPKVVETGQKQMARLNTNTRYLYPQLTDYAEKLLSKFPQNLSKVFFVNSGSAASDLAIRLAQNFTNMKKVMVLEHGYHGNTRLGIDISHYKFGRKGGKGQAGYVMKTPIPDLYRGKFGKDDPNGGLKYAEITRSLLNDTPVAAFIAEPIVGCAGQVPLADGYLSETYKHIRSAGGVCISDEVQTGFGRLGSAFWGFELHDVVPDIVVLGKPIGNGHPLGAVVTTDEIAEAFDNGMEFFSSFGGNPVSCAIGQAVLEVIDEEGLQSNALETGYYYMQQLNQLMKQYEWIGDVRGHGLFIGVELVKHRESKEFYPELAAYVKNGMREMNVLISTDGPMNNILKIKPPLCFNKENVNEVIEKLDKLLKRFDPYKPLKDKI